MAAVSEKSARLLGEKIKNGRVGRSQEYVAARLNKTKGWLSKVEKGDLSMDQVTLVAFGRLVGWSDMELAEALALLEPEDPVERTGKLESLRKINEGLKNLEAATEDGQMGAVLMETFGQMQPVPTLTFLQFMEDVIKDAIATAEAKQRNTRR